MSIDSDFAGMFEEFKSSLLKRFDDRFDAIDKKIDFMLSSLNDVKCTADKALLLAEKGNTKSISNEESLRDLIEKNEACEKRITLLENELDDQVNRSMRDTLVFKNVPGSETAWENTAKVLSRLINECDPTVSEEQAFRSIERAHRVKRNPVNDNDNEEKRKGSAIITAKFASWKCSEQVKEMFRKNKESDVIVEPLLSKKLFARTNEAKLFRKEERLKHPKWKMFVSYPAN